MFRFDRTSLFIAFALLASEVLIASFAHDRFVRPYVGDVLVVMLIFFAIRALWQAPALPLAAGILCFAVLVETTQALHLIDRLGWSHNTLAKLVLGNTFQWGDMLCYIVGSLTTLVLVHLLPSELQAR